MQPCLSRTSLSIFQITLFQNGLNLNIQITFCSVADFLIFECFSCNLLCSMRLFVTKMGLRYDEQGHH